MTKKAKSSGIWVQATKNGYDSLKVFRRAGDKFEVEDERLFSDEWMKRIEEPKQDQKSPEGGETYEALDRKRYGKFSNRNAPTPDEDTRSQSEKLDDAERRAAEAPLVTNTAPLDKATKK